MARVEGRRAEAEQQRLLDRLHDDRERIKAYDDQQREERERKKREDEMNESIRRCDKANREYEYNRSRPEFGTKAYFNTKLKPFWLKL